MYFPFLELPRELRLMVYECLPISTKHLVLEDPLFEDARQSAIRLVIRCMPVQILATCRAVYQEAHSHINKRIVSCQRLQIIVDSLWMSAFDRPAFESKNLAVAHVLAMMRDGTCTVLAVHPSMEGGPRRSAIMISTMPAIVSTEYAIKLRRFVASSHKFMRQVVPGRTAEIAVRMRGDVRSLQRRLDAAWPFTAHWFTRQHYRLYVRVDGHDEARQKTGAWRVYDDGPEEARELGDAEWEDEWEQRVACGEDSEMQRGLCVADEHEYEVTSYGAGFYRAFFLNYFM